MARRKKPPISASNGPGTGLAVWALMQLKMLTVGLVLALNACGGSSTLDATGGSAGASGAGGSSGGSGGASGGTGAVGGSAGSGAVSGSGGAGGSGGDACHEPSLKACNGPAQCALTTSDCCLCGMPELSDYVAMNQASAGQCTCQGPICDCVSAENPNLAASCETGQCVAWDVRQREDYSGCTDDLDCRLRNGLDCCEDCLTPGENLVAVRTTSEAALKQAMCAPNSACSKCMVQYPANAKAVCNAGHCQVMFVK